MNKYPSKYSNGKSVSAAQFIAETICERLAKKQKKDLHFRFWLSKEWEKEYKGQIAAANKLLKTYNARSILKALQSEQGLKIYSLRAPHLPDIIQMHILPDEPQPKRNNTSVNRHLLNKGREHKSYNILDKLKDIDNGTTR